jgi:hypothetical protein
LWSYIPQTKGILGMIRSSQERPIESRILQEFEKNVAGGMPGTAAMMEAIHNHMEIFGDPQASENLMAAARNMTQKFTTSDIANAGGGHTIERFSEGQAAPQYTEAFPGMTTDKGFASQVDTQPGVNGQAGKLVMTPLGRVGPAEEFQLTRAGLLVGIDRTTGNSRVIADYRRGDTGATGEEKNMLEMLQHGIDPNFAFDSAFHLLSVRSDASGNPVLVNMRTGKMTPLNADEAKAVDQANSLNAGGANANGTQGGNGSPTQQGQPMGLIDALTGGSTGIGPWFARAAGNVVGAFQGAGEPAIAGHAMSAKEGVDAWKLSVEQAIHPVTGSRMFSKEWDYIMNQVNDVTGFDVGANVAIRRAAGLKDYIQGQLNAKQQQLQSMPNNKANTKSRSDITSAMNAEQMVLRTMQGVPSVAQLDNGWTPPNQGAGGSQQSPQGPAQQQPQQQPQRQPQQPSITPPAAVLQTLGVPAQAIHHGTFYGKSAWSADNGKTIVGDDGRQLNTGGQ